MQLLVALLAFAALVAIFHGLFDLWKWNNRK